MHARWIDDPVAFVRDVVSEIGSRPKGKSIDRIDNNGNYEPGNVRWATAKEQANNFRKNLLVTHHGVTHTASEWASMLGISSTQIAWRASRGMSSDQILDTSDRRGKRRFCAEVTHNGVTKSLREWANAAGISRSTLYLRLRAGWDFDVAISRPLDGRTKRGKDKQRRRR